ncbi:GATA zinc finger domain-containing protein 14-like [Nymphalis io]|uniref:GATA zinc finger domain-containing protein 14-like n=1 Tax=Inachis io TaxID=171585 RepID=UPI0021671606|nr:GATA zinc finger domain-containing protein 14-like [Nymphalis io]
MNKWRLLLLSIFGLLHITTSESDFFDGRYGCYAYSPRYLPSDTSFSAYETNREHRFLPEIPLNPPKKYPTFNVRDTEIVWLSRRRQIRDIKQHSRDNEIRQAVGGQRNRISTSPSDHIRNKREYFVVSSYERSNDLRSNLRHNRLVRDRDTEYQRSIRTTSSSRDNYRKQYATRTHFENRDVSRYNNNDRHMLNAHNNNKDETQRKFSEYDALSTRRNSNRNDMRNGDIYEEPDQRNLRIIRSDRPNDNDKLSKDRNSRLGIQRDLYEDRFQRESRNSQRNNVRSLDRLHFSQTNIRSLVRDIENSRTKSDRHQPFVQVDINGERKNRLRSKRSSSEESYLLREDQNNARPVIDKRNVNYNSRSTRDTNVNKTLENRQVRKNVGPKINRVNMNTRSEANSREVLMSRFDRRNVNFNARSTRDTNVKDTSENREVRNSVGPKINRVNMNTRLEAKEREVIVSRFDRRNVHYNARSTRDTNEKDRVNMNTRLDMRERETSVSRFDRRNVNFNARSTRDTNVKDTSENREVRNSVGPKMNRVNMNTRLDMRERETSVSRFDRRNVHYNARSTRETNEKDTSENREVRNNVGPKMNRVNMNTRLDMRERETSVSRFDRRNVNFNARSTKDTNVKDTSENREVRNSVGPKMNRVNMNTRLDMRERETSVSRFDRRNVHYNARSTRDTNEKDTSENREVRNNVGPKMNRVNMNTRLDMRERETSVSRFDRRNVNFNARSTRDTNVKDTSENREVRNSVGPKMNRVNMNTRLDMRERETSVSRFDRRNVHYNARSTRDTNEKDTSENREVRNNVGPKMNRINMNTKLEANEREVLVSRFDRRNVNFNARSTRDTNVKDTSENREVRNSVGPKINRVNMNTRLEAKEREIY